MKIECEPVTACRSGRASNIACQSPLRGRPLGPQITGAGLLLILLGVAYAYLSAGASSFHPQKACGERAESHSGIWEAWPMARPIIMAIDQGNRTGEYELLRKLGTPGFRGRYTQSRLSAAFANLREQGIDLGAVLFNARSTKEASKIVAPGRLYMTGEAATPKAHLRYQLLFVMWNRTWRIDGLSLDTFAVQPAEPHQASEDTARETARPVFLRPSA